MLWEEETHFRLATAASLVGLAGSSFVEITHALHSAQHGPFPLQLGRTGLQC